MNLDNPISSLFARREPQLVDAASALPGRDTPVLDRARPHTVLGTPLIGPWPEGTQEIYLALGCFWGAEKLFWQLPGVISTSVGYMGGFTPHPTYEEVCTGKTGHAETVHVAYDPDRLSDTDVLRAFWEAHDPTQGFRQGNDIGTQYRSAIYWTTAAQHQAAEQTGDRYAARLAEAGYGTITTEVRPAGAAVPGGAGPYYLAEDYHQQYLDKNPSGYCPVHSTGVACS